MGVLTHYRKKIINSNEKIKKLNPQFGYGEKIYFEKARRGFYDFSVEEIFRRGFYDLEKIEKLVFRRDTNHIRIEVDDTDIFKFTGKELKHSCTVSDSGFVSFRGEHSYHEGSSSYDSEIVNERVVDDEKIEKILSIFKKIDIMSEACDKLDAEKIHEKINANIELVEYAKELASNTKIDEKIEENILGYAYNKNHTISFVANKWERWDPKLEDLYCNIFAMLDGKLLTTVHESVTKLWLGKVKSKQEIKKMFEEFVLKIKEKSVSYIKEELGLLRYKKNVTGNRFLSYEGIILDASNTFDCWDDEQLKKAEEIIEIPVNIIIPKNMTVSIVDDAIGIESSRYWICILEYENDVIKITEEKENYQFDKKSLFWEIKKEFINSIRKDFKLFRQFGNETIRKNVEEKYTKLIQKIVSKKIQDVKNLETK